MKKDIEKLIYKEFANCNYKGFEITEGTTLFSSTKVIDYWLVSSEPFKLTEQKKLYDKVMESNHDFRNIEKNLTLLLLLDNSQKEDYDTITIENDKSYFKKYVLSYNDEIVQNLCHYMEENGYESISNILMNEELFDQVKNLQEGDESLGSLVYSIAHKLLFLPIKAVSKDYTKGKIIFENDSYETLLTWVNEAPIGFELEDYVDNLIKNSSNE